MGRARRYSLKQTATSRLYSRNDDSAIAHFHSVLNLPDVVFVSIDIEGRSTIGNSRLDEIGVSVLDTRQFRGELKSDIAISSRHICTRYAGKNFLFGDSERRGRWGLGNFIRSLFYIEDIDDADQSQAESNGSVVRFESNNPIGFPARQKKYRDIVLVGHGLRNDASIITEVQVDVQAILPIVDMVDTEVIGMAFYKKGIKLAHLLDHLGCPYAYLHNAGNDAAFALRALLGLALETQWAGPHNWLLQFQKVAFAPLETKEIGDENLARGVADRRAQDRRKDWADALENQAFWDLAPDESEV